MNMKDEIVEIVEILLVEDSKHDAELTMMALEELNLTNKIKWLRNGEEALNFLFGEGQFSERNNSLQPRVILLDLKMPKVGGLEVLRKIRSEELTRDLPVVVLTSSKEDKDLVESYRLNVNSYIVKPVEFEAFAKCVKDLGYYWALVNKVPGRE